MPLILPGNVASATASTTYSIANSCRWNFGDSPAMNKSQTAGNKKTWTYSWWCKRGEIGGSAEKDWFKVYASGSKLLHIRFNTNDTLYVEGETPNSIRLTTNRVFRDPSAWYHFALIMDTTQSTDSNRMKLFVNGKNELTEGGGFASVTYPTEDGDTAMNDSGATFYLGTTQSATEEFDGYMAEVVLLDGTAAAIGDLGEFDSNSPTIWKPKDPSGLSFGNNGFWLDFEDSSNLGNDKNGGTDFSESNLDATDQAVDSPTNNFCTWNPMWVFRSPISTYGGDFDHGNVGWGRNDDSGTVGTMGFVTGKWYMEFKPTVYNNYTSYYLGIWNQDYSDDYNSFGNAKSGFCLKQSNNHLFGTPLIDVAHVIDDTTTTGYSTDTIEANAIVGMAINLDDGEATFYKDGSAIGSAIGSIPTGRLYTPGIQIAGSAGNVECSFGGCPSFSISSAQTDGNGYGIFEHAPPSGFFAICSKNYESQGG